jgi:hypothetical protein
VPQVQAFAVVAANRGRFGLDDLDPAPAFELGEIVVPAGTPIKLVAKAAGVPLATLRDYNPGLLRDRTPPGGGDSIVNVPADKVAAALAAFPSIYARAMEKEAAADAGVATGTAAAATASASAAASPAEPPPARFTIAGGVIVEHQEAPGDPVVSARVEIVSRGIVRPGSAFPVTSAGGRGTDLASALGNTAAKIRVLVTGSGEAIVAARRDAGEGRRQQLARAPYGNAWLSLGEKLFPPGHALAGTVLVTPAQPLQSVAIAEPSPGAPSAVRITVTVTGSTERGALKAAAERAFAGVLDDGSSVAPPARGERVTLTEPWPSARIVLGWLVPSASEAERAALRLAILAIAHNQVGKVARALVKETLVAVHVRGFLDLGERASVAAVEVVPSVMHDVADVEREADLALAAFADRGLTAMELAAVKAQLRARLQSERDRAGATGEPREAALARIARTLEAVEAVTGEDLVALMQKSFGKVRRVVVITQPKG